MYPKKQFVRKTKKNVEKEALVGRITKAFYTHIQKNSQFLCPQKKTKMLKKKQWSGREDHKSFYTQIQKFPNLFVKKNNKNLSESLGGRITKVLYPYQL
jgi:hypothetical protein